MHPNQSERSSLTDEVVSSAVSNCLIRVHGTLDARWAEYIGEFSITDADESVEPSTLLTGFVPDQTALLGVLLYLDRFGMRLVMVEWK